MSLTSDVNVDAAKFDRKNIDQETLDFNQKLIKIWADGPRWYEVCSMQCNAIQNNHPVYIRFTLILTLTSHRSAQLNTANYAGTAKRPCPNPLFSKMG
jgi:hypothetical protein